jgi:hypothetical protein
MNEKLKKFLVYPIGIQRKIIRIPSGFQQKCVRIESLTEGNKMTIMQIVVPGTELENITINLDTAQVTNMYLQQLKLNATIAEQNKQNKELMELERKLKYAQEGKQTAENELQQAHGLMTALGIDEKTKEEETYYRKPLTLSTRIAMYIATFIK